MHRRRRACPTWQWLPARSPDDSARDAARQPRARPAPGAASHLTAAQASGSPSLQPVPASGLRRMSARCRHGRGGGESGACSSGSSARGRRPSRLLGARAAAAGAVLRGRNGGAWGPSAGRRSNGRAGSKRWHCDCRSATRRAASPAALGSGGGSAAEAACRHATLRACQWGPLPGSRGGRVTCCARRAHSPHPLGPHSQVTNLLPNHQRRFRGLAPRRSQAGAGTDARADALPRSV